MEKLGPKVINYIEEPKTNSAVILSGTISDTVRQAVANAQIRLAEAKIRKEQGNPMTLEELNTGLAVSGRVVKK